METVNGLYKAECIGTTVFHDGPYKTIADVEYATAGWVDWSRYAGDPLGGRGGRAGRVAASIGDLSCRSFRAFGAMPVRAAVS